MFRSKSSILGYLHLWKPPVLKGCLVCQICQVVPLSQDGGEAYSDFNLTVQCSAQQLSWIWLQVKRGLKGCKKCDTSYERNETQFSKLSWSQKQADLWDPMSIWVGLSTEFGTPSIPRWKRATFAEVIDTFDGWALLSGLEAQT